MSAIIVTEPDTPLNDADHVGSFNLSRCENYADFTEKLNHVIKKLYMALRNDGRLAILVGDIRLKGNFYSMPHDIMRMGKFETFIYIQ